MGGSEWYGDVYKIRSRGRGSRGCYVVANVYDAGGAAVVVVVVGSYPRRGVYVLEIAHGL